jgi:hypothetical protein
VPAKPWGTQSGKNPENIQDYPGFTPAAAARPIRGCDGPEASMLDIFAWIVLIVLVACTIAVIIYLAMLPGMIARRRGHPWSTAVTVGGWVTLFLGFALWPLVLIWAYVDVPSPRKGEAA